MRDQAYSTPIEELAMAAFVGRDDVGVAWGSAIIAGIVAMIVFAIVEIAFS